MNEPYVCMRCKAAGAKSIIRYKIIEDITGDSVKFKGQLCERCFNELMAPAQNSEDVDEKKGNSNGEDK